MTRVEMTAVKCTGLSVQLLPFLSRSVTVVLVVRALRACSVFSDQEKPTAMSGY